MGGSKVSDSCARSGEERTARGKVVIAWIVLYFETSANQSIITMGEMRISQSGNAKRGPPLTVEYELRKLRRPPC